jgi:hypothetical protein
MQRGERRTAHTSFPMPQIQFHHDADHEELEELAGRDMKQR